MNTLINQEQEPFIWIDYEVNDFNKFAEMAHSWEIDFLQLDGKPFHSVLQQIIFPEIQIGHTHFNCHLDQKGASPKDMWTFVIMGENASMFKFNHEETLSTSTMVIYSPGHEINAVSYEGFHIYTFSIRRSHFKQITKMLGLDKIEEKLSKIDRVELDPKQADSLRKQLKDIVNDVSSSSHKVISPEGKKLLLHFLPVKFLKEIGAKVGCTRQRLIQEKAMLFMEARSYMHTHLHKQITISEIATKFKLSERTLRNYFKEELNISPKKYLITLRLRKINYVLRNERVKKGIIEQTARRFGFTHMGEFSKSYKDFFGELPSETLR